MIYTILERRYSRASVVRKNSDWVSLGLLKVIQMSTNSCSTTIITFNKLQLCWQTSYFSFWYSLCCQNNMYLFCTFSVVVVYFWSFSINFFISTYLSWIKVLCLRGVSNKQQLLNRYRWQAISKQNHKDFIIIDLQN